ncbi:N-acetylneuraminate lyase-like [Cylas formicarius]|uniref:N-acetylneuraminate lyase-like n=1 Tax=Cylas formicarius TaxID=197179 RepID=UPI00295889F3|nr:N-acetylneuraminate lyase-like [Cylas formicarius]
MLLNFTFIGLMAPVFTIFDKDSSINTEKIPNYANYLSESGIHGILVHGTSGEATSLSVRERKDLAQAWSETVKNTSQHLMVQVGGCPLPDVLELAKHAEEIGADSILCMPELYFKPKKPRDLINYLKHVSDAAPNTPLLYYHNPGHTGVNIDMAQFLEESTNQLPTLKGIKFTSNDLAAGYAALKAAGGRFTVFIGGDLLLAPAFALGFDSAIATSINIFPSYATGILEAVKMSDVAKAQGLQENLTAAMKIIRSFGPKVPTTKVAMNYVSPINVGHARAPLENLSEEQSREMRLSLGGYLKY